MPAAAVIPAPIAYIKVVAVKTLVVGYLLWTVGLPQRSVLRSVLGTFWRKCLHLIVLHVLRDIYFEEMRVFQAGICRECASME